MLITDQGVLVTSAAGHFMGFISKAHQSPTGYKLVFPGEEQE